MLQGAKGMVWRATLWLTGWVPLALLAGFSGAATLYAARYGAHLRYAEHWGLVLIGICAVSAVGALRRVRGLPMWPTPPNAYYRPAAAFLVAVFSAWMLLRLSVFLVRVKLRDYDVLMRGNDPNRFIPVLGLLHHAVFAGLTVALIAGCLAAVTDLLRASGRRPSLALTSALGVGLGLLRGAWLRHLAGIPAKWPHGDLVVGALIGLAIATIFWTISGVGTVRRGERHRQPAAASPIFTMSPAAWAGFRRALCAAGAILIGTILTSPYPFVYPMVFVLAEGAPAHAFALILLFIVFASGAWAANRFRDSDVRAFAHGKRMGVCTGLLFLNVACALPASAWEAVAFVFPKL